MLSVNLPNYRMFGFKDNVVESRYHYNITVLIEDLNVKARMGNI